jgi:hypothetical protein
VRALAPALVASAVVAAPASGAGATGPSFAFGRGGGNIKPLAVRIAASGRVTVDGTRRRTLTHATLRELLRVALAQRFFALPPKIVCPAQLPDFATLYVTVRTGTRVRTVTDRGNCNKRFIRVYDALTAVVGSAR